MPGEVAKGTIFAPLKNCTLGRGTLGKHKTEVHMLTFPICNKVNCQQF